MSTTAEVPGLVLEDAEQGSPAEWMTPVVIVSLGFADRTGQWRVLRHTVVIGPAGGEACAALDELCGAEARSDTSAP